MPRYVVKIGDDEYFEWSTVVDAPVGPLKTRLEMASDLADDPRSGSPEDRTPAAVEARLARADKHGTSALRTESARQCMLVNRAGPGEACIDYEVITAQLRAQRDYYAGRGPRPVPLSDGITP